MRFWFLVCSIIFVLRYCSRLLVLGFCFSPAAVFVTLFVVLQWQDTAHAAKLERKIGEHESTLSALAEERKQLQQVCDVFG